MMNTRIKRALSKGKGVNLEPAGPMGKMPNGSAIIMIVNNAQMMYYLMS